MVRQAKPSLPWEKAREQVLVLLPDAYVWYSEGRWSVRRDETSNTDVAVGSSRAEAWIAAYNAVCLKKP